MFNAFSIIPSEAADPRTHNIEMSAEVLPDGKMGYKMISHVIIEEEDAVDVTDRYDNRASIPGPTIIIDEGDEVFVTLNNNLGEDCVSIHVHGVPYISRDDGTLKAVNGVEDSCSATTDSWTYHWTASKGSAGVWPYHDHTFGGQFGAELEGLYGTLIVNEKKLNS